MNLSPEVIQEILRSSNEAIVVVDAAGNIAFVNREAEQLFGYEADEMLGQPVEMLLPESMRDRHAMHRQQYAESPHKRPLVSGLSLKARRKDGHRFDAEISLTPVRTKQGMLVSTAIRDISQASPSEAYFKHLLETAPDAMIIVDQNGRIAIANEQAVKMFGYSRSQLLDQPVELLLPSDARSRHQAHRAAYVGDPRVRPMGEGMELAGRRADGSTFPVEISLSPVPSESGMSVCSVIRDVTERKRMEQELIAARYAAERANKANTAFLAAASHDLRQPVQALSLLNGALRRTVKDELALEMIESQQLSVDAMTNLLNSLLDISRLDAGAIKPEVEEFPIQRLFDRLSTEFARQARQKGLRFETTQCGDIVRSDPNLLGEIIQNFVSNAIRYTNRGKVVLSCRELEGGLCVDVQDTGVGIKPEHVDDIFREFHQLKTPGAKKEGFGLGLAIVRRLADLLEHEVQVESTPGKGSRFSVCMPLVARREPPAGAHGGEDAAAMPAQSGELIILIEDDVTVAQAWGLLLESEGYQVATAESASEARAILEHVARAPALIISDYHLLDGSTGVQAVLEIRKAYQRNIPAFIVSGDTSKVVQEARSLDNCELMSKPVNIDRLLRLAKAAIATGSVPAS